MTMRVNRKRVSRRTFLKTTAAAGMATVLPTGPFFLRNVSAAKKVVYTEQYGGNWEQHFKNNIFPKFTKKTGIEVITVPGAGSKIARIDQMVKAGKVELDVLATDASDVIKGKKLGLHVSQEELSRRRENWSPPKKAMKKGYLSIYSKMATSPDKGAALDYDNADT